MTFALRGFPGGAQGKEPACRGRRQKRRGFDPWVGRIPWRRTRQLTPVLLPGESHGQRSLVGYSPWGRRERDTTGHTHRSAADVWASRGGWEGSRARPPGGVERVCSDGAWGEERWETGLQEPQIQAQRPWGATGFASKRDVAPRSFAKGGEATAVQPRHRRQGYAPHLSVHPSGLVSCGHRRRKLGGRGSRLGLGAPSSLPWRLRRVFRRGQGHVAWRWVDPGGKGWGDRTEPGPGQHRREAWASNLCLPSAAPAWLSVRCLQGLPRPRPRPRPVVILAPCRRFCLSHLWGLRVDLVGGSQACCSVSCYIPDGPQTTENSPPTMPGG